MILYIVSEISGHTEPQVQAVCKLRSTANRVARTIGTLLCIVETVETIKYEGVEYAPLSAITLHRATDTDRSEEALISAAIKVIDNHKLLGLSKTEIEAFQKIVDGE